MTENEDDWLADEPRPEEIFGEDLWKETRGVVDQAHELLNGPDGEATFEGTYETERVRLDLPKGLLLLAAYAAIKSERGHIPGEWPAIKAEFERGSEKWRKIVRSYLTMILWNELYSDLHQLAVGTHPVMARRRATSPEAEEWRRGAPDACEGDEYVPF